MASCDVLYQTPGPRGQRGTAGTNGSNGSNAFSLTTAAFTMPAEDGAVAVAVDDAAWMSISSNGVNGQVVHVQNAGYMLVSGRSDSQNIELTNLGTVGNAPPATTIPSGSRIAPAGLPGDEGDAGASGAPTDASYWVRSSNATLSNETNLSALGAGIIKINGSGVPSIAVAETDYLTSATALISADIGIEVQAFDALLAAFAALTTAADRLPYFTGLNTVAMTTFTAFARTLLDDADATAMRTTLGLTTGYGLLGSATAVNHNSVADTAITMSSSRYRIDKVTVEAASTSLTTATAGVFTASGGGGTTIVADQALSALTASTKFKDLTLETIATTDVFTASVLNYRVGTAQGSPATATVRIYGWAYA